MEKGELPQPPVEPPLFRYAKSFARFLREESREIFFSADAKTTFKALILGISAGVLTTVILKSLGIHDPLVTYAGASAMAIAMVISVFETPKIRRQ